LDPVTDLKSKKQGHGCKMVMRGKNSYGARVTDTALGTIHSLGATVQGFEERAERLELDIADAASASRSLVKKSAPSVLNEKSLVRHPCQRSIPPVCWKINLARAEKFSHALLSHRE
jgi:hypothetical protein